MMSSNGLPFSMSAFLTLRARGDGVALMSFNVFVVLTHRRIDGLVKRS